MYPGSWRPRMHLALSVVTLDRTSCSSGTQFLHGTDTRVEMENLKRSTHFPQTQQFYNPCSVVGRLNSRLSVVGRQYWECKRDHWWGRFVQKSQIKFPIVLTATTMGRIILSWAWNQVTFLSTDPINYYCVRGCGHAHATVLIWRECYEWG